MSNLITLKVIEAAPFLKTGKKYKINPYPHHMVGVFVEAMFCGDKSSMKFGDELPPPWSKVFDFSSDKNKELTYFLKAFSQEVPMWTKFHGEKKIGVDHSALIQLDPKELCY